MKRLGLLVLVVVWQAVVFDGRSALGQPRGESQLWVVIVNIEDYQAPIPKRPGLALEGRKLLGWFRDSAGWGDDWVDKHVLVLNEGANSGRGKLGVKSQRLRPNRENLHWAIDTWLRDQAKKGDVVVFAFSGRSARIDNRETLLPSDYQVGQKGWSPEPIIDGLIRDGKADNYVFWIDAPIHDPVNPAKPLAEAGDQMASRLAKWPGSTAWVASGETASGGHGFSTRLRESLGDGSRNLRESLGILKKDSEVRPTEFHQVGGVPSELRLSRGQFRGAGKIEAELLAQSGHSKRVNAIAWQDDAEAMFTASDDSTIRAWSPTASRQALLRAFTGFLGGVTALAQSPDGRYLVGGDAHGKILAWDLQNPESRSLTQPRKGAPPHNEVPIKALVFLPPDSKGPGARMTTQFVSLDAEGHHVTWRINESSMEVESSGLVGLTNIKFSTASKNTDAVSFAILGEVGEEGVLLTFDRSMKPKGVPTKLPPANSRVFQLDPDGRSAVVGDDSGWVRTVDLIQGQVADFQNFRIPVTSVKFGPARALAIGTGNGVFLGSVDRPDAFVRLEAGKSEVLSLGFSADGRWLAAIANPGNLFAWKLEAGPPPQPCPLANLGSNQATFSSLGFGLSSKPMLVAGENDGGIRRWDLKTFQEYPRLEPLRGQVKQLSASRDGRFLLQLTDDGVAQVWDLKEGRTVRSLDGFWASGTFLRNGKLAMARHVDSGDGLVVVDPKTGRTETKFLGGSDANFARVVAAVEGDRVVASTESDRPVVHVWDRPDAPLRKLERLESGLASLEISANGQELLTAEEEGRLSLWNLDLIDASARPIRHELEKSWITAAKLAPVKRLSRKVLFATDQKSDDPYKVWAWDLNTNKVSDSGSSRPFDSKISALTFLNGGRYVAASGQDGQVVVWDHGQLKPLPLEVEAEITPGKPSRNRRHHAEAISDLLAWPISETAPILVSGSKDSTIRFWKLDPEVPTEKPKVRLIATLIGVPEARSNPQGPIASNRMDSPWIAFTPQGFYDSSLEGEQLASFSDGRRVAPLEPYASRYLRTGLTDSIREGKLPPDRPIVEGPPPIAIEPPDEMPTTRSETEIKVTLGDKNLTREDLRLYVNDTPVRLGDEFLETSPGQFLVKVTLKQGNNWVHAMASRKDDIDACSEKRFIYQSTPDRPGKIHVISLGVGKYNRNALRYPADDARAIADYLQGHGIGAGKTSSKPIILLDEQVTQANVEGAFDEIHDKVKGHPEDTVVVFVAGHTDIIGLGEKERYSLLLPRFPFPENAPTLVTSRGPEIAAENRKTPPPETFLPYERIYRYLSRLDALQRLVIVDACQAEAIIDDPGVRRVNQLRAMDRETRQSRTNYFLASRKGEAAGEDESLKHGLLTYVMLRGMGAPGLAAPPAEITEFGLFPNAADQDRNGTVTTRELHAFVDRTLPPLADRLTGAVRGPAETPAGNPATPSQTSPRFALPSVQAAGLNFPLVVVPLQQAASPTARPDERAR